MIERFRKLLVQTREATRVRRVFLFDAEFRSLVDTREDVDFGQTLYGAQADRAEIEQTFQDAEPTTSVLFRDEGTYYKTGYAPIMRDGEVVAAVGVEGSAEY
ncbi:MAG: two-component sensor histidine kinase, partial [Gemmatimonadota bacterium]